ncbi:MAG: response regulator [Deltaproteobacteria bacterium]|nr:response regulator [Deltaproteobacteria bacterium]
MTTLNQTRAKPRSLVVDDCRTILALVSHLLKDAGYEVTTCENPILVPALIFREKIDLVLLDVRMPGLTGEWVAETVADKNRSGAARILFYSSEPEEHLKHLVESTGAAGYVQKSADDSTLLHTISRMLNQRGDA